MPVLVVCPNPECRASFSMPPDLVGRRVKCRSCGTKFEAIEETSGRGLIAPSGPSSTRLQSPSSSNTNPRSTHPELPPTFGRYTIVKQLGQGGMGTVYLARDVELDRLVALKVPHLDADSPTEVLERFRREARAAAGFHHPNFCPIHEVGQVGDTLYLAMAYIEGVTLESRVRRDQPLPPREAAAIVRQLALALAEAHRRGIIHRDLKPANVMVDARGNLILMDFGLARKIDGDEPKLTQTGMLMGTPHYMSPEQLKGASHDLGPATDIYALGVILYELSTGRLPFEGSMGDVIGQVIHVEPKPPSSLRPEIDAELNAITLKTMSKSIEARYPSMDALAEALAAYLEPRPVAPAQPSPRPATVPSPRPATVPPLEPQPSSRRRRLVLPVAGALLGLLGLAAYVATDRGTLKLVGLTPGMEIWVDGQEVHVDRIGEPIVVRSGRHGLSVTWANSMVKAPRSFEIHRGQVTVIGVERVDSIASRRKTEQPKPAEVKTASRPPKGPTVTPPAPAPKVADAGSKSATPADTAKSTPPPATPPVKGPSIPRPAAVALVEEGDRLYYQHQFDQAVQSYERAIKLDPNYATAYAYRGFCRHEKGDLAGAMADFNQAIKLDPALAVAYMYRANCRNSNGDHAGVIADCGEVIRLDPKCAPAFRVRGISRHEKGDPVGGLADLDEAIRLDPTFILAYQNRGVQRFSKGDVAGAMADLDEAIRLDPTFILAYQNRGVQRFSKGDVAGAMADLDEAIKLNPALAVAYSLRGLCRYGKGDLAGAMADFDQAIKLDPKAMGAEGYIIRGHCRSGTGDLDGAMADYDAAIKLDPMAMDAKAFINRGRYRYHNGDLAGMVADLDEAIKLDPTEMNAEAYTCRGNYWRDNGDPTKATADFEEALKLDPKSEKACAGLAWILATCPAANLRNADRAVKLATMACESTVYRDPVNLSILAAAEANAGSYDKAVRRHEEAIKLMPYKMKVKYQSRISLYQAKLPYRDETLKPKAPNGP